MKTERAIELLNRLQDEQFDGIHGDERREALEMAVRALSGGGDTIYRQQAIEVIEAVFPVDPMKSEYAQGIACGAALAKTYVEQLPSAQPEIIRCTECKHYREYDSKYVENAVVVQCMADRYPISETIPDGWFCAGAERKDDE